MIEAGAWGLLAASSLVLGALLAFGTQVPARLRGAVLAFGAGTLFGAVAYELVEDALAHSVTGVDVALGFAVGALVFFGGSVAIDRLSAGGPGSGRLASRRDQRTSGLALVLGSVLDGLPESIVLGLSFVPGAGVGLPVLVAVFLSNIPEGLSGSEDLSDGGLGRGRIVGVWVVVAVVSGLAAALGYGVLGPLGSGVVVTMQAFAAGAILAMLAESMIPEAHEVGGRSVGLAMALGFAVAAYLSLRT